MKKNTIILILLLFFGLLSNGQSYYHFTYQFKNTSDSNLYDAFLVINGNGTGSVRIKYKTQGKEVLLAMVATEEELPVKKGGIQTGNRMGYRLSSPEIVKKGIEAPVYSTPFIWFMENKNTGFYEPYGVTVSQQMADSMITPFSKVELFAGNDLTKDMVLQYFMPTDDFYMNKFVKMGQRAMTPMAPNTKMILMTVGNIKDIYIGEDCKRDVIRAMETFSRLAKLMGIPIDTSAKISGDNYNKQNVVNALDALKPAKNDIVIFYYTGHGFRRPGASGYYPDLDLRSKIEIKRVDNVISLKTNYLNAEDILKRITSKGARFNMVITDCCNLSYDSINCKGRVPPRTKEMPLEIYRENARALFFDPVPQSLLFTSASIGEKAISNPFFGSFFSYHFKLALESHLGYMKKKVSWSQVFAEAKQQTNIRSLSTKMEDGMACEQNAYSNLPDQ